MYLNKENKNKPKLIILSDSYRKYLSCLVEQRTFVNAFHVVKYVKEMSRDLTNEDHYASYSRDENVETTSIRRFLDDIRKLISNLKKTNLIISAVPMRHDRPDLDFKIALINLELEKIADQNQADISVLPIHLLPCPPVHYSRSTYE